MDAVGAVCACHCLAHRVAHVLCYLARAYLTSLPPPLRLPLRCMVVLTAWALPTLRLLLQHRGCVRGRRSLLPWVRWRALQPAPVTPPVTLLATCSTLMTLCAK